MSDIAWLHHILLAFWSMNSHANKQHAKWQNVCNSIIVRGVVKGAQSDLFNFFPNFRRFWYHKKAHIFLITHVKFHGWKVFRLEEINENVPGYGNHNHE